jgi:phage terminase large subunit-like protein
MTVANVDVLAEAWLDKLLGVAEDAPLPETVALPDIVEWAEENFYIVETGRPIRLMAHQKDILRLMTERRPDGRFRWRTCIYSTIKKSGKTTVSALYARWAAETWGPFQEIYNLGNKLKQAKERAFRVARRSIELAPLSTREQWDVQATRLTHLPSGSFIEALPISGAGEAGGNQSLTVWTELWGFQYDQALLMWDELKPVLTRPLSQRLIDTYAGFKGVSELLWEMWERGLQGERLTDDLPVYGNEAAGLIAYIDQGAEARRMPWQQGAEGRQYYQEQAVTERPENYTRHHENQWAESVDHLINIALWDRLEDEPVTIYRQHPIDVVLAADASISGDCTALSATTYDPERDVVIELTTWIWDPQGEALDYEETLEPELRAALECDEWRIICVAYDPYQLHDLMTRLGKEYWRTEFYSFPQGGERLQADTALVSRIRQGKLAHSGNGRLREHLQNADKKASGETAIRIVKRENKKPVDGAVALSMAAWKVYELLGVEEVDAPVRTARAEYG